MSEAWASPGANPLRDIREFMEKAGRYRPEPFTVYAPPPLGCLDCGLALPDCHQRHGGGHCERHDVKTCEWAKHG